MTEQSMEAQQSPRYIRLIGELADQVTSMAETENRSVSNMGERLIREAIQSRIAGEDTAS